MFSALLLLVLNAGFKIVRECGVSEALAMAIYAVSTCLMARGFVHSHLYILFGFVWAMERKVSVYGSAKIWKI
jgi:hypothetical protein